jgi:GNAT superfamily N-acetyltransferase
MHAAAAGIEHLDNVIWETLSGLHARHTVGTATARRMLRGFPPFAGFADNERPDLESLRPFVEPGEPVYTAGWRGAIPRGWHVDFEAVAMQYVYEGDPPAVDAAPEAVRLGTGHVDEMTALTDLTKPGPFGPRNIELGEYYGIFDEGRLVAMTGERLGCGGYREVSGVCTHPVYQGRGHARRLMEKVMRLQMARGERPCLHVMAANARARSLYERMGFRARRELLLRSLGLAP